MYVCVCATCKIAPWLQSKSMQSKQEMATIEEMEGGEGGRREEGVEARRQMESPRLHPVSQKKKREMSSWQ